MANTWSALAQGVTFAATKNMLSILNGGSRILRIKRIYMLNIQTAAVTGVICLGDIRRYTSGTLSSSTAVTAVAHDTDNSALDTVTIGYAGTLGGTPSTFRRYIWSSDEPAVSSATSDELECIPILSCLWDASYGDSTVQPIVLRANQMLTVYNTSGAAGLADIYIEFLDEAS
jgi:hypothetical protein